MSRSPKAPAPLPLMAWGNQLRAEKRQRQRLGRRIAATSAGIFLLGLTLAIPPAPRFVWNASASAPIGLYAVTPGAVASPGDMVVAWVPDPWRRMAAERRYLPLNIPLVKRVAAGAGDEICALDRNIFLNGRWLARRMARDAKGRTMPGWSGCVRLRSGQFFLLMPGNAASFDGRYFGASEGSQIVGKARLLWAR